MTCGPRLRVLVADDHPAALDSLVALVSTEHEIVAAVRDGQSAVSASHVLSPDILVLDIAMPGLTGIAAAMHLDAGGSTAKFVFVTARPDYSLLEHLCMLGSVGFVVKDRLASDLLTAIRTVHSGRPYPSFEALLSQF